MGALAVWDTAQEFLSAAVDSLDTLPGEAAFLLGAPARQYVATGTPVIDCEQVSVWVAFLDEAPTTPDTPMLQPGQRGNLGRVNVVTMNVMVARCIPVGGTQRSGRVVAPAVDDLNNATEQTLADAWVLWCGLNAARKQGRFGDVCSAVIIERATPLNPGGGFGGWQLPITVQLDGYPVPLGS